MTFLATFSHCIGEFCWNLKDFIYFRLGFKKHHYAVTVSMTLQKCEYSFIIPLISSVQFSRSVVSDSLQPHDCSTPGLPVHHQPPEFTQTHVHQVGDVIPTSHPLSSLSPPAPNPSQHQSLFQ